MCDSHIRHKKLIAIVCHNRHSTDTSISFSTYVCLQWSPMSKNNFLRLQSVLSIPFHWNAQLVSISSTFLSRLFVISIYYWIIFLFFALLLKIFISYIEFKKRQKSLSSRFDGFPNRENTFCFAMKIFN